MTITNANPINEVQLKPPAVGSGLLGVAPTLEVDSDGVLVIDGLGSDWPGSEHWVEGMAWLPEGCALSGLSEIAGAGTFQTPNTDLHFAEKQEFQPFVVWARDNATALDQSRDRWGRAQRGLLAERSYQIAKELEAGAFATAASAPNKFLNDGDLETIGSGTVAFAEALNCMDGVVTRRLRNRQGMVHMTPDAQSAANELRWIRWNGATAYTPAGHVIVADAGYSGFGPETSMIFGTDMIRVLLGPIKFTPDRGDLASAQAVLGTNDISVRAFQPAAYQWDGCCHVGITTDLPVCA